MKPKKIKTISGKLLSLVEGGEVQYVGAVLRVGDDLIFLTKAAQKQLRGSLF